MDFDQLVIGDLCFYHYQGKPALDRAYLEKLNLTAHYFSHNASRPPLILAMPDASSKRPRYFLADGQCYSNPYEVGRWNIAGKNGWLQP